MQKRLLAGILAVTAAAAALGCAGLSQAQTPTGHWPVSNENDQMATPLEYAENTHAAGNGGQREFSSVSSMQQDATNHEGKAPKDYLQLTIKNTDLLGHSRLKARAVSITVQNTQPVRLEIMQAQVLNGLNEMDIVEESKHNENIQQRAANFLRRGSGMVSGFGVIGANNYGASSAMAPTPAMNFSGPAKSAADPDEGQDEETVSGKFVNQVRDITLNPNQTYTFKALIPAASTPQLKLRFKNLKTGQIFQL